MACLLRAAEKNDIADNAKMLAGRCFSSCYFVGCDFIVTLADKNWT